MTKSFYTILFLLLSCSALFANGQENVENNNRIDDQGRKQGHWVIKAHMLDVSGYPSDATVEEGEYIDDIREGEWVRYYPSGVQRSSITYKGNLPNGPYKVFYENGQVEEDGNWKRNKNTGDFVRYHENGQLQQKFTFSASGKREGRQFYYHENGKLAMEVDISGGKENGDLIRYDEQGNKVEESKFYDGVMEPGSLKQYGNSAPKPVKVEVPKDAIAVNPDTEGKQNQAQQFKDNGFNTLYDKNHQVTQVGQFKNGRLWDGKWMRYNRDGIMIRIDIYKGGRFIGHGQIES